MKDLTFGEQVKIILSRKGMTIKELAEEIQEETGKAMSRQNLTQRLGRDNFQEQDMRMIAAILGCPFRLSIFPLENEEEFNIDTDAYANFAKKSGKKKKEKEPEEVYQQQLIFDETMTASVAEEPVVEAAEEVVEETAEEAAEEVAEETAEEAAEEVAEEATEEAAEEVAEEATEEAAEEEVEEAVEETAEEAVEEVVEEYAEEPAEETAEEVIEEPEEEAAEVYVEEHAEAEQGITIGEFYEMQETPIEEIEEPEPVKPDRFRTGFLRGFGRNKNKKNKKAEKREEPKVEPVEEPVVEPQPVVEKKERFVITPDSEEFEPVLRPRDIEEDLNIGELNPYTGHEYQSNSVRMHPSKIGYVQVYDRAKHGWTDMTEWAFLGYQEEKKKLLGRDYASPIYLD